VDECKPLGAGITPEDLSARYVKVIRTLPYWNRSGAGRDHIFLWPSGRGRALQLHCIQTRVET
jgi:hypothetical protein